MTQSQQFGFRFEPRYRIAGLPFGVRPSTTSATVEADVLTVRFGPWRLRTPLRNIASAETSGPFTFVKTAGPAHLSFADRGVTFATNSESAACLSFHEPVPAIDPTRRITHPNATLTVADVPGFLAAIRR